MTWSRPRRERPIAHRCGAFDREAAAPIRLVEVIRDLELLDAINHLGERADLADARAGRFFDGHP